MTHDQLIKTINRYNRFEAAIGSGCRIQIILTPGKNTHISVVHRHMDRGMFFTLSDDRTLSAGRGDDADKAAEDLTKGDDWLSVEVHYDDRIQAAREQLSDIRNLLEEPNAAE